MFLSGTQKNMNMGGGGEYCRRGAALPFLTMRGEVGVGETVNSSQKRKKALQTKQSVSTSRDECSRYQSTILYQVSVLLKVLCASWRVGVGWGEIWRKQLL